MTSRERDRYANAFDLFVYLVVIILLGCAFALLGSLVSTLWRIL